MPIYAPEVGEPDEEIFAALGRLVYAFAQLEEALGVALVTALGNSDDAAIGR